MTEFDPDPSGSSRHHGPGTVSQSAPAPHPTQTGSPGMTALRNHESAIAPQIVRDLSYLHFAKDSMTAFPMASALASTGNITRFVASGR